MLMDWEKLFSKTYPCTFGKHTYIASETYWHTSERLRFELEDSGNIFAEEERGNIVIAGTDKCKVFEYERYHKEHRFNESSLAKKETCTKRCDYIIFHKDTWALVELTTAKSEETLSLQDKRTGESKSDKMPKQLAHTAKSLALCGLQSAGYQPRAIAGIRYKENGNKPQQAFNRPLRNLELEYTALNKLGYTYWRIVYPTPLTF